MRTPGWYDVLMRALTMAVVLALAFGAAAEEPQSTIHETTVKPSPPASTPPGAAPAPSPQGPAIAPSPPGAPPPPSVAMPPPPPPPPTSASASSTMTLPAPSLTVARSRPSPDMVGRWRTARALSVVGSVLNVIGTGLSLSSVIYIVATDYPPSATSLLAPAKPSDVGPALAYAGASVSAAGFILSASGLGYQHRLLDELSADPGRGAFGVGTAFGIVGFANVGLSYFFGLTDYLNPHDQSVAILATSLTGTALCAIAGILYSVDSSRVKKAWEFVSTF